MTWVDPRGIMRTIVAVDRGTGPTLITMSCGHVGEFANHFTYKIGTEIRCFRCGQQARGEEPLPAPIRSSTRE